VAKLPNGNKTRPKKALRTSIDTLRATIILPTSTEHRKLPRDPTPTSTLILPSWHPFIIAKELPIHTPTNYNALLKRPNTKTTTTKRPNTNATSLPLATRVDIEYPPEAQEVDDHINPTPPNNLPC
jgi:hypothetical protein